MRVWSEAARHPLNVKGSAFVLLAVLALSASTGAGAADEGTTIREGVLDKIIIKRLEVPEDVGVIVRRFSTERTSLGTAETGDHRERLDAAVLMQREGPITLAEEMVKVLSVGSAYKYARQSEEESPQDALIVEGRFTLIDPGSKAKRWALVGTTGRSRVGVKGTVKNAAGELLAEFEHVRQSGARLGGGDYVKSLTEDTRDVAQDIAVFLKRWATGGNLHEEAD